MILATEALRQTAQLLWNAGVPWLRSDSYGGGGVNSLALRSPGRRKVLPSSATSHTTVNGVFTPFGSYPFENTITWSSADPPI